MKDRTAPPTALACTKRETARLLRIDRGATLDDLIARKLLTPIPWGKGGWRIPLEQIQHLARTGFTVNGKPSRAVSTRRAAPAPGVGNRIRAIEVEVES